MKKQNRWHLLTPTVIFVIALIAMPVWAAQKSVSEDDMGIRKTSLYDETNTQGVKSTPGTTPAGKSKKYDRSFENSPPLIPHSIEGLETITEGQNSCMNCHDPKVAQNVKAVPIPNTHLKDSGDKIDGNSYHCVQCHVVQSDVKPAIENKFTNSFRNQKSRNSSNLSRTQKEGVD
ncbi:MAG: nitrate reductase cytochrome c-type subunit [Nitrospirae bacterium]|nr:nitrate reductase cytochrome c-type subunit [Nitrospirota bacterium]